MLCLKVNVKDVLNYVASLNWCFLNLQVTETNPCCAKASWTLILMMMWEPEGAQWQEEDTRRRQPKWSVHLDGLGAAHWLPGMHQTGLWPWCCIGLYNICSSSKATAKPTQTTKSQPKVLGREGDNVAFEAFEREGPHMCFRSSAECLRNSWYTVWPRHGNLGWKCGPYMNLPSA